MNNLKIIASGLGRIIIHFIIIISIIYLYPCDLQADMMKDSPVTFPAKGALPAKYPPDVRAKSEPAEKDYYIFRSPGCQHYKEQNRITKNLLPRKPDLVLIGGISQKTSPSLLPR